MLQPTDFEEVGVPRRIGNPIVPRASSWSLTIVRESQWEIDPAVRDLMQILEPARKTLTALGREYEATLRIIVVAGGSLPNLYLPPLRLKAIGAIGAGVSISVYVGESIR